MITVYQLDEVNLSVSQHEVPDLPLAGKELMGAVDGLLAARVDMDAGQDRQYSERPRSEGGPPVLKLVCTWGRDQSYTLYACPEHPDSAKAMAEGDLDDCTGEDDGEDESVS